MFQSKHDPKYCFPLAFMPASRPAVPLVSWVGISVDEGYVLSPAVVGDSEGVGDPVPDEPVPVEA